MRVLVLGVTGFAGRHLVRALAEAGHEVLGTSRSGGQAPAPAPEAEAFGIEVLACDVTDRGSVCLLYTSPSPRD